ncbi:DUF6314 family protein [Arthrobacter sp. Br18]|uniref:DUF6314 family protein n=1 Tax=Arthrobacter sp. Br18 TaxID=1312954 RepID=UPI0004BAA9BC|nr:DUF6314 family protein [Arthrobacter sp. Br18]
MPYLKKDGFPVADAAVFLLGAWTAERTLVDNAESRRGTFTGITTFTPDDAGRLAWVEVGTVAWPAVGAPTVVTPAFEAPAFRKYLLEPGATRSGLRVLFADGRPFHDLDLATGVCTAEHWCSPDTYGIHFLVRTPDVIEYSWEVHGPAKDQLLTTVLRRRESLALPHELRNLASGSHTGP